MRISAAFLLLLVSSLRLAAAAGPNIVYFMADDLGYGDVKCYGKEKSRAQTPNFDRLASEGVKFTDAHAVAAVCVPSRVAVMTGRYPWRFARGERGGPWGFIGLQYPPETFTLGDLLRGAGYRTGYVGKWHLGTRMTTTDNRVQTTNNVDYAAPLKVGPVHYGFDYSFILPGSLDMYPYVFVRNNRFVGRVNRQRGWSAFNRVGPTEENFEDHKVLNAFSTEAERFIARNADAAKRGRPFFLYVALTAPHTPTSPHPKFRGKSELGLYGDFLMETDDCLGRVMRALEEHGLTDNTLLVATSDHGPASYAGNEAKSRASQYKSMEALGHHSAGPFRGFKFSIYEGGRRVPFIVRWPGVAAAGRECDRLVGLQDVFGTFAAAARERLAPDQGVDSVSLLPLLRNPAAKATRADMIQSSVRSWAVRQGDWKLCFCPGSGCPGTWGNEPSQHDAYTAAIREFGRQPTPAELLKPPFVQLFNLRRDPTESDNVAAQHPERVAELTALFERRFKDGRSTPGPKQPNGRSNLNPLAGVPKFVRQR